jgi:alpha-L-fucosidase
MPSNVLASLAKQAGVSLDKAEEYWDRAKEQAAKQGHKDDYAYIVGIVKKMLGLESQSGRSSRVCEIIHELAIANAMTGIKKIDITYQDDSGNIKVKTFTSYN